MNINTTNICGINHSLLNYDKTVSVIEKWIIKQKNPQQVVISNVNTIITCLNDPEFNKIINTAAMTTIDGQPLLWYARLINNAKIQERVCGPDLMLKCISNGISKGWKHYFLGGEKHVLEDLCDNLAKKYPGLIIAGKYSPPFRPLLKQENNDMIAKINQSKPDILWVGLGSPKQEKWIADNLSELYCPVQIGVGAAFDFYSNAIKRAPQKIQNLGLEWFYRIFQSPRLIERYLSTNPVFIYIFIRDYLKKSGLF